VARHDSSVAKHIRFFYDKTIAGAKTMTASKTHLDVYVYFYKSLSLSLSLYIYIYIYYIYIYLFDIIYTIYIYCPLHWFKYKEAD